MEQESYWEGVAKVICELTGHIEALDVRKDGVYVKSEFLDADLNQQAFTWSPACEMDWPGAPDPLTEPALRIPFTARDLAAFMLDGAGQGIQSTFGHIELAPDEDELSSLDMRAIKVRKALREAYNLAQQAQRVVGTDNHDEQDRADDLLSAYRVLRSEAMVREQVMESLITREEYLLRLARVHEPLAAQKAEAQKAKAEADTGHREWLKAMVNQLLNPALSAALCATPVPVEAESASGGVELDKAGPAKPLQRTAAQDSAILCEIEKQGYDPLALPKNLPGKPGVKAAIRAALSQNSLFTGRTVFDKAWERLTASADIAIHG